MNTRKPVGTFDTRKDCQQHYLSVAEQAERYVYIVSERLDPFIFEQSGLIDELTRIVMAHERHFVRILVQSTEYMVHHGHLLLNLARKIPSRLQIRKIAENIVQESAFMIADDNAFVYQPICSIYEGQSSLDDRYRCKTWLQDFSTIWEQSQQDPNIRQFVI